MLRFRLNRRAQNAVEYGALIALVIAAAIAMQTYFKRGWQGGMKFAVDKMKRGNAGTGQYEPYYLKSNYQTTASAGADTEEMQANGAMIRTSTPRTTTRTGSQTVSAAP